MQSNLKLSLTRGILTSAILLLAGCYSVTVRPDGGFKVATKPTFEQRQDFYLWGLVGERHVNVKDVCNGNPVQFQSQRTFVDGLLGLVTLGIYAPETARIWCK